jgi:chromosomal replication initiation ATPase DnaA
MCALGGERSRGIGGRVKPHSSGREGLRQVIDPAVALVFEVDPAELGAATRRSPRAAFARQVAMYLTHVVCGMSMTEVGALFSRDRTTVAHACEVVEDRRDDPELDSRVERLECAIAAVIGALSWRGRSQ